MTPGDVDISQISMVSVDHEANVIDAIDASPVLLGSAMDQLCIHPPL